MKNKMKFLQVVILLLIVQSTQAQLLKKIKQRVKSTVEETVVRKSGEIAEQETSKKIDTIYENVSKPKESRKKKKKGAVEDESNDEVSNQEVSQDSPPNSFGIYSNFTFSPGNKLLFYDDFTTDALGDFPALWETGGSGEVVTTNTSESKWLSMVRRSGYMPTIKNKLPENYTMEFDLSNNGYGAGKPSSKLFFAFLTKKAYAMGSGGSNASVEILLSTSGFNVRNVLNFGGEVEVKVGSFINREMPQYLNTTVHISIAVNKKRLRMWVNEEKIIDSPNLLQANIGKYFIIEARDVLPEKGHFVGISNFRIAEATEDLRSLLLKNGKFSTTGIYFETDSWIVKKESYGIIKDIATMLKENEDIKLQIVGHTDSQGKDDYNLMLSENRAEKVKQLLTEEFGIDEGRIQFTGKGETEPVDDNTTEKGRANNRRVEFIKI